MGLNKSRGNMYDWVTHTLSMMTGCSHQCTYCYVRSFRDLPVEPKLVLPFPKLDSQWRTDSGELRTRKTIFINHMCDMFARNVPEEMIRAVLDHCRKYPENTYVFQTKNPGRFTEFAFPPNIIRGTTIETDRQDILYSISQAPSVFDRSVAMGMILGHKFVTIEPILEFNLSQMLRYVLNCEPEFVNIGADSKGHRLPEPTRDKVERLILALKSNDIEVKKKSNLERLL
jgi:DNA repair photolyase